MRIRTHDLQGIAFVEAEDGKVSVEITKRKVPACFQLLSMIHGARTLYSSTSKTYSGCDLTTPRLESTTLRADVPRAFPRPARIFVGEKIVRSNVSSPSLV